MIRRLGRWFGIAAAVLICAAASTPTTTPPTPTSSTPAMAELTQLYQRPESIPFPPDDPYSEAKEKLGRMLFFDPILSGTRTVSCASCHNPGLSWSDGRKLAAGVGQMELHTPTLIDVAWVPILGWDGKYRSLESVAFGPLLAPLNMNNTEPEIISRLAGIPGYVQAFARAFPEVEKEPQITRPRIEQAIATFERTIQAARAPFDRWIAGDETAISSAAKRGFVLFNGKASCADCHQGPSFTDFSFHDIGIAREDDIGRGRLFPTGLKLQHAFKVPTLRDVARRAPYMHDGSLPTLEAVVDEYDTGGIDRPSRSSLIHPLGLTADEKRDLVTFMKTLTGERTPFEVPTLPR
jgi:cytochrome c peroxidase